MTGTVIADRYRLDEELRADADARVFAATELRMNRPVRVRVLRPERASDDAFMARQRDAASQAGSLINPHIVAVYDYDLEAEMPFLVTARPDGRTLAERLAAGERLTPDQARRVAEQAGRALAAAHRAGIVHGALLPSSIIVADDGTTWLADFDRPALETPDADAARYLAPEQILGEPATPASDVYALGSVLYHAITGQPAFDGAHPVAIGTRKLTEPPVPVERRAPELPTAVAATIDQALNRQAGDRPDNGDAFAQLITSGAATSASTGGGTGSTRLPDDATRVMQPIDATRVRPTPVVPVTPVGLDERRPSPPRRAPERGSSAGTWLAVIIVLLILGGVWAIIRPGGTGAIPVPEVLGETEATAVKAITELKLQPVVVAREHSDDVPGGRVLAQEPKPGHRLDEGETVALTVSRGPKFVTVPRVTGMRLDQARTQLAKNGLIFGGSETVQDQNEPDGVVVVQSPIAGSRVDKGTPVTLYVNDRPEPEAPPVVEEPVTEAPPADTPPEPGTEPGADGGPGDVFENIGEAVEDRARDAAGELADQARDAAAQKLEEAREAARERVREGGQQLGEELRRRLPGGGN